MAIEYIIHLINTTGAEVIIEDLGFVLQASEDNLSSDQFSYSQLCDSEDLKDLINAGTITLNDGSTTLSTANAIAFLTRQNKRNLERDYYTKTNLQTTGQASVNWNNISGAPTFGSATLINPVKLRVTTVAASPPVVGAAGDFYVDTTSSKYFKSDGTIWVEYADTIGGDRVIVLDNGNQSIFAYSGSSLALTDNPLSDDMAVLVDDDGDGKQAQYVYNSSDHHWYKIGDVDFGPHMDGAAGKHKTTEIQTITTLTHTGTTAGDSVDDALSDIDTTLGNIQTDISTLQGDTTGLDTRLDTAEGKITNLQADSTSLTSQVGGIGIRVTALEVDSTSQDGRLDALELADSSIIIDINELTSSLSDLEILVNDITSTQLTDINTEISNLLIDSTSQDIRIGATETKLADINIISGRIYGKDTTRSKLLGSTESVVFQKSNAAKNTYLRTGDIASNVTGIRLYKTMTLVSAAAEISASGSCEFRVRKNNNVTDLSVITISSSTGITVADLNIDFSASDVIEVYCTCPGVTVNNPILRLVFAENGGAI